MHTLRLARRGPWCVLLLLLLVQGSTWIAPPAEAAAGVQRVSGLSINLPWVPGAQHSIINGYGENLHQGETDPGSTNDHFALDFDMPENEEVRPTASGQVVWASTATGGWCGYGKSVAINHANGYTSFYAHLSSISVSVGQNVTTSTRLGAVGHTGCNPIAAHLHFALYHGAHTSSSTPPYGGSAERPEPFADCQKNGSSACTGLGHDTLRDTRGSAPSYAVSLAFTGAGHGSVSSSPSGLDCSSNCSHSFSSGTSVTVTASPASGSRFVAWHGRCDNQTSASCTFTVTGNIGNLQAEFALNTSQSYAVSLAFTGAGHGSVSSSPSGLDCSSNCSHSFSSGTSVTVTASPASGSRFVAWHGRCDNQTSASCTFTVTDNIGNLQAEFALTSSQSYAVSLAFTGSGSGSVSSSPSGLDCTSSCSHSFTSGTAMTVTASPASGSRFVAWHGRCDNQTSASCTFTVTDNIGNLQAEFARRECAPDANQVAVWADPGYQGTCVVRGVGNYGIPSDLSPVTNDTVSSVKVGSNVRAVLCRDDNFAGGCETISSDDSNLSDNVIGDNSVSSLRVETRPVVRCVPNADQVAVYVDAEYASDCRILEVGDYANSAAFPPVGDNSISSIQVGANVTALLCDAVNFGPECREWQTNDPDIQPEGWADKASSVRVIRRPPPEPDLRPDAPDGFAGAVVPSSVTDTHTTSDLRAGEHTYWDWRLINSGLGSTGGSYEIRIWVDDQQVAGWTHGTLGGGESVGFDDWLSDVATPGLHTVRFVVDAGNQIAESDETNNEWTAQFTWLPPLMPDLQPFAPDGFEGPVVPSSVQGTHTTDTLRALEHTYWDAWYANTGGTATSASFKWQVWLDGQKIIEYTQDGLGAGVANGANDWLADVATAGEHAVRMVVDPDDVVAESDETNNEWTQHFVWETALRDCRPSTDRVVVYEDANAQGRCRTFEVGDYRNAAAFDPVRDGQVSSMHVGANVKVLLCDDTDFGGACREWSGDDSNLSDEGWNDRASSIRVYRRCATGPDQVVVYEAMDFQSVCRTLTVGTYANPSTFAPVADESISSVYVGSRVSVKASADPSLTWPWDVWVLSDGNLHDNGWGDRISSLVVSRQPANDDFSSAATMRSTSGSASGTNVTASLEAGEPQIGGGASVWWRWVAPRSGRVTIKTKDSSFDTTLAAFTGSSVSSLRRVAFNDNATSASRFSKVVFSAVAGRTYWIAVDGVRYDFPLPGAAGQQGSIVMRWRLP